METHDINTGYDADEGYYDNGVFNEFFFVIVIGIAVVFGGFVFVASAGFNSYQDKLAVAQESLNSMSSSDRRVAALDMITTGSKNYAHEQQLVQAAETGDEVSFNVSHISLATTLGWMIGLPWAVIATYATIKLCTWSWRHYYRVIAVNFNVRNIVFLVLTVFPIGWLVYLCSTVRLIVSYISYRIQEDSECSDL